VTTHLPLNAMEARAHVHRLHLAPNRTYSCRFCREAVRVTSARYLPERCDACGEGTWEADDLRCGNWIDCDAVRRPGIRGRAHCHACGYSVWVTVSGRVTERV
jgi:formylmethanofuran dehydrogenase subunit E